jgi:hypothetical protein
MGALLAHAVLESIGDRFIFVTATPFFHPGRRSRTSIIRA